MSIEAMKQWLEAFEYIANAIYVTSEQEANAVEKALKTITSIRQAIATEESSSTQEPACCSGKCPNKKECESAMQCLYNHPQPKAEQIINNYHENDNSKREWVGLTDEERDEIYLAVELGACGEELVEAKLKEKNT